MKQVKVWKSFVTDDSFQDTEATIFSEIVSIHYLLQTPLFSLIITDHQF